MLEPVRHGYKQFVSQSEHYLLSPLALTFREVDLDGQLRAYFGFGNPTVNCASVSTLCSFLIFHTLLPLCIAAGAPPRGECFRPLLPHFLPGASDDGPPL